MQPRCIILKNMTKSDDTQTQWTGDETAAWTGLVRSSQELIQYRSKATETKTGSGGGG